jgi:hypothetical protein
MLFPACGVEHADEMLDGDDLIAAALSHTEAGATETETHLFAVR